MLPLLASLLLGAPTAYAVDPAQTELVVLTTPAGLFAGASHPHVLVARQVQGEVTFDPEAVEATRLWVHFPADALENDDPAWRARFKLAGTLPPEARREVAAALRSEGQLDVKRYPQVSFRSREVRRRGASQLEVSGTLTVRGVGAQITLPVHLAVEDGVLRGEGTVGITHAMFGFQPYVAALGTVRNAEEMTLRLRLVARAAGADSGAP
jgi:polyisoprenoid-binding protein YceI